MKTILPLKRNIFFEKEFGIVDPAGIRSLCCHLSPGPGDPELIKVNPLGSIVRSKL